MSVLRKNAIFLEKEKASFEVDYATVKKKYTVENMIGTDEFAQRAASEKYSFLLNGEEREETLSALIDELDSSIWNGHYDFARWIKDLANDAKAKADNARRYAREVENKKTYGEHENFGGYIEDLKAIYEKAVAERQKMIHALEFSRKERDEAAKNGKKAEIEKTRLEYGQQEILYRQNLDRLNDVIRGEINAIRDVLEKHLEKFYTPNGSALDADTVALLHSGIILSGKEVDRMVTQFKNNPTMLRLLNDYSKTHDISDSKYRRVLSSLAESDGRIERESFEGAVNVIMGACHMNQERALIRIQNKDLFMNELDKLAYQLDNFILRDFDEKNSSKQENEVITIQEDSSQEKNDCKEEVTQEN